MTSLCDVYASSSLSGQSQLALPACLPASPSCQHVSSRPRPAPAVTNHAANADLESVRITSAQLDCRYTTASTELCCSTATHGHARLSGQSNHTHLPSSSSPSQLDISAGAKPEHTSSPTTVRMGVLQGSSLLLCSTFTYPSPVNVVLL